MFVILQIFFATRWIWRMENIKDISVIGFYNVLLNFSV